MICENCLHYNVCTKLEKNGISRVHPSQCGCFENRENWQKIQQGKWIATDEYMTDECSIFHTHIQIEDFEECAYNPKFGTVNLNYCPYCGTKMNGGKENA